MEKLAKQIKKIVCDLYDDTVTVKDVLNWMLTVDEDELIVNDPETLAGWYH